MMVPNKGSRNKGFHYGVPRRPPGDLLAIEKQFNKTATDFLKVDLATALTFAATARHADDPEKKSRNQQFARKAHDTVLKMGEKVHLSNEDAEELEQNLRRLRSELVDLGEVF